MNRPLLVSTGAWQLTMTSSCIPEECKLGTFAVSSWLSHACYVLGDVIQQKPANMLTHLCQEVCNQRALYIWFAGAPADIYMRRVTILAPANSPTQQGAGRCIVRGIAPGWKIEKDVREK